MANGTPKNHSEVSRGVLKSECTIYNCINAAVSACIQCASYSTVRGYGGCRDHLYSLKSFCRNFTGHDCSNLSICMSVCVSVCVSILSNRSPTCMWIADGRFLAFEGKKTILILGASACLNW